jgi:putative glutamine amidotransferase
MWQSIRLGILLAGGRAKRLTALSHDHYPQCDGYIISGGVDIDPASYGQENIASHHIEPARDAMEKAVIEHGFKAQKPVFGICRGTQMINIVSGGTLHQEARDIYADFLPTSSVLGKIFQRRTVWIEEASRIARIFGTGTLRVNSIHHQAVDELGFGFTISAKDRHGIVQAIEAEGAHVMGVQWHPELMLYSKIQRNYFHALITACRKRD